MSLVSASGYEIRRQAWFRELEECVKDVIISHKLTQEDKNVIMFWPQLDKLIECYERRINDSSAT